MTAQKFFKGFTLVELLIVITLLGTIATMVIATINPIEISNRARDAKFKTDAGQLISAIDRYFAAASEFPWVTEGVTSLNNTAFGFTSAGDPGVGVCLDTDCAQGVLISTDELKPEFASRDFIKTDVADKKIYIGKATGASESIYACFVPAAKSTQKKALADTKVYNITVGDPDRGTPQSVCADWTTCYVCIPE